MKKLLTALAVAGAIAGILGGRFLRRYAVEGRSMLRGYAPDDRLVVEAVSYRLRSPRIGEAVVVRWPHALTRTPGSSELDLKRIAAGPGHNVALPEGERVLGDDEWYLLGDNLDESTDSRQLGPVRRQDIAGRVWLRY